MATSWKSMYNDSFENPNQIPVDNPNQCTFEHPDIESLLHFLSINKLQGSEPFVLAQIIKNEMGEKQRMASEIEKLSDFAIQMEANWHQANAHSNELKHIVEKCEKEKSEQFETILVLELELANAKKAFPKISKLESELANAERAFPKILELESELANVEQAYSKISELESELENSRSTLAQKQGELTRTSNAFDQVRQEKDCLQANLLESMARHESLKILNQSLQQEKLETEALSTKIQSELKQTLSMQTHLLNTIQKLEIEVFESHLDGISPLFENSNQNHERENLVKSSEPKEIVPNSTNCIENQSKIILPSLHFKDRVDHEKLINSVEYLIERHYTNKGFGQFYGVFQKHFPDACHIM